MSLTQVHYDKPRSHSNQQTRFIIPRNRKVHTTSMRLLDLVVNPNQACYFPALVGAYALIKKVQVSVNSVPLDEWMAQSSLPYLVAQMGDNEKQRGIVKELYLTGNNVIHNPVDNTMNLDRPEVDSYSASVKMMVYSDLLANMGICNDEIEIIIDWEDNLGNCLVPVDPANPATSINIQPMYLVYETFVGDMAQPSKFFFRKWVEEQMNIPVGADNTLQTVELRSNAFNQKTISRLMISNLPITFQAGNVNADAVALYRVFSKYCSVPMLQESFNVGKNGETILSLRNVNNDSLKLGMTGDTWGKSNFVSGAHLHLAVPMLQELNATFTPTVSATPVQQLNGFASYGSVDISEMVTKDMQFSYTRLANSNYPTLKGQMLLVVDAEVNCVYENGQVSYV
jgi:hypothetical protein